MQNQSVKVNVLVAVKNEEKNLPTCLRSCAPASRILVVDSNSTDQTGKICKKFGADLIQFQYSGIYPKKRQWALNSVFSPGDWVLLLDADEEVPDALWMEINDAVNQDKINGFMGRKIFHFLGRKFRHGGFSFSSVILVRCGFARFEEPNFQDRSGLDMEVHERVIVDGKLSSFSNGLLHHDYKGLQHYIHKHNQYSTWECAARQRYLGEKSTAGRNILKPSLFGNIQQQRRFLKQIVIRLPFEPIFWFVYHYIVRFGFLEGRPGLYASLLKSFYFSEARMKLYENDLAIKASEKYSEARHD